MRRLILWCALLLALPVQAADLGLQATALRVEGHLDAAAQFGALQAMDSRDGQVGGEAGPYFLLHAQTLRVVTDARPVTAAAGAHVPGDVRVEQRTFHDAQLRAVQGHPDHSLIVLPSGQAAVQVKAARADITPQPAQTVAAQHFVDPDRAPVAVDVGPSARMAGLSEATVDVSGDLVLVVWAWTFLVDEGTSATQYRTGYDGDDNVTVPFFGEVAGVGERRQAYIHATNATLTLVAGAFDLFVIEPTFHGVTTLAATATGRVDSKAVLSQDVEIHGDAMRIDLGHDRRGLLDVEVTGAEWYRVAGGPRAALATPGVPVSLVVLAAVGVVAAIGLLTTRVSAERRLAVARWLSAHGRLRAASVLLRWHRRRDPDCVPGLLLLAETAARRGRLQHELGVRLHAATILVDGDRIRNARRVLHLYGRLGHEEDALAWFEACRASDPGLMQDLMAEPMFRSFDARLRARAQSVLGWEDPTGA